MYTVTDSYINNGELKSNEKSDNGWSMLLEKFVMR